MLLQHVRLMYHFSARAVRVRISSINLVIFTLLIISSDALGFEVFPDTNDTNFSS